MHAGATSTAAASTAATTRPTTGPRAACPPTSGSAVHALYAFVREADEIVDGPGRARRPGRCAAPSSTATSSACTRRSPASPRATRRSPRWSTPAARHDLPLDELGSYFDSMRIDCAPVRMAHVGGARALHARQRRRRRAHPGAAARRAGRAPRVASRSLALAFQLTNFIRDVREDWELDRIYLPARTSSARRRRADRPAPADAPASAELLAVEVGRARELFREGARRRRGGRAARAARDAHGAQRLPAACSTASSGSTTTCCAAAPACRPWELAGAVAQGLRAGA